MAQMNWWVLLLASVSLILGQVEELGNSAILINTGAEATTVRRSALEGRPVSQAISTFFLGAALLDYTMYFIIFIYVFFFVMRESGGVFRMLFTFTVLAIFSGLRLIYLPLILSSFPFSWAPEFNPILLTVSFWFCTISYVVFFNAPIMASLYYFIKFGYRGEKMKGGIVAEEKSEAPMVVILMPIYNEEPESLFRAVQSAIRSDYPGHRRHVILAFDDATESTTYWSLLKSLNVLNMEVYADWQEEHGKEVFLFPPRLELLVEGVRMTLCRFDHGGKSATQGKAFQIINEMYGGEECENTYLMFIDSDIILHENALYNFVATLVSKPGMSAVTGYITCRTSDQMNFFQYLQDCEYLEGQMFWRCLEAMAGSITCLPGALTLMRLSAMQKVAPKYFIEFDKTKDLHFHRYYLGEDRYMTHLLMEEATRPYSIGLCGAARCKTDAPDNWAKLLKQRRRWYLGALINECHMLATPHLWKYLPVLLTLKLFDYASGNLSWLFIVYLVSVFEGIVPVWTMWVFFPCLVLKYVLLSLNASLMNRNKVFWSFPILFFVAPLSKMLVVFYSLWTWSRRSWGGPRTDVTEIEVTQASKLDDLMQQRAMSVKRSKNWLKMLSSRLKSQRSGLSSRTTLHHPVSTAQFDLEKDLVEEARILPFPYEVEILGGGEIFTGLLLPRMIFNEMESGMPSPSLSSTTISRDPSQRDLPSSFHDNLTTALRRCQSGPLSPEPLDPNASSNELNIDQEKYIYGRHYNSKRASAQSAVDISRSTSSDMHPTSPRSTSTTQARPYRNSAIAYFDPAFQQPPSLLRTREVIVSVSSPAPSSPRLDPTLDLVPRAYHPTTETPTISFEDLSTPVQRSSSQ